MMGTRPGADRIAAAQALVDVTGATVLLKGPTTVVASVGRVPTFVCSGDQRLATAGTGDVLAGIVGALLAQGLQSHDAAVAGAYLHGLAARRCSSTGVIAGDLVDQLPHVMGALT